MTKRLITLLVLFLSTNAFSQSFTSIWNTNNTSPQSPSNTEITIPTNPAFTNYNYNVDWGDGASDSNVTGNITHTYGAPGSYTISISGDFPAIYFNDENTGDKLKIVEILDWGDIQWQSMENAFYGCENINFDAINSPDLSQVTSLKNMFRGGTSFNGIVNNWDVSTITDISGIFAETDIFNRPLDNWTTSSITDMSYAFYRARRFNEPLDNWNTGAVTTMEYLFSEASQFNQNINNWNVTQVTNMSGTFRYASSYNNPLNNWVVNNVTNMSSMLAGSAFNFPIENWNVSNVTDMSYMFYQASQFNQSIQGWDVSNVTDMSYMLARMPIFNQPVNGWDVSSVTNMAGMFDGWPSANTPFNQPLNGWDVSNVTDMSYMFRYTRDFNQPLDNWVVDQVTNMEHMFERATVFNQDISGWNVDNVTLMNSMFSQASIFNQDISGWNVANVTEMSSMFYAALAFDQPLNGWDVSKVTTMASMFRLNPVFNQPLDSWNTGEVTTMTQMFANASSFNQNLAAWNISKVRDITLSNSGISQENYDNILIGWSTQTVRDNVNLGATNLNYCDGLNARQELIDNSNWNITGDIVNCSFVLCADIISPFDGDTNVPANSDIVWNATPNATGYRVSIRREDDGGNILQVVFDDEDLGNTTRITFTNEFFPGDNVFVTVVPYNDEGPATGCQELYFKTVPSWVNSPAAFKLTYDTRILENGTTAGNQLKIETNSGYPGYFDYDYSIDWGDNQYNNNVTGDIIHTYGTPGVYTISIIGDFPAPLHDYSNTDAIKLLSIDQWGTQVWQSMERAFYYCENMEYNATDIPNLSNVTNMSSMFSGCNLFNGNMNAWNVSNVRNMSYMLIGARAFNQPLDQWDVSNVENMSGMLFACEEFNQPIGNWITSSLTNTSRMFNGAEVFNQPLNSWDMSKVVDTYQMFANTDAFNQPLNNWDVSQVTNMNEMFSRADAFNQPIEIWNVGNVTSMISMFNGAEVFNQPLNQWNVSNVLNMASMFRDAAAFNHPLNNWNVSLVSYMSSMFNRADSFNQNINTWNVTNVIDMSSMFNDAEMYNQPMSDWDVNSVVNMSSMFQGAEVFNQPLDAWDVSAVANMSSMFEDALLFNQPLNSWDVSSVTLIPSMFEDAAVFNSPISNWNVASVTNMEATFKNAIVFDQPIQNWNTGEVLTMEEMFSGAATFNQEINAWNTSFVTTMKSMFESAAAYNQTMDTWNVASVSTMEEMFKDATSFNQNIDAWNVRGVNTMYQMFSGATAFNQSINSWRVSGVTDMGFMFNEASAYNQPMDQWNLGDLSMRSAFYNATAFNQDLSAWDVSGVTDMQDMLDNTALTRENYDNTLIAWSEQNLTNGITLGAEGLPYCDAVEERQSMIDTSGWTFSLDVRDCPIPACTQLTSPLDDDIDVPVNTNITWEAAQYARGYYLTVGTTSGGNDIVNNETINDETTYEFTSDFNTGDIIYVTIIPFNDEGQAVGPCLEESFTISSDPATIPDCTNLDGPLNNANDVAVTTDLSWDPISNADGYRLTVGTTSGGNEILDNEDVGNVLTYDLAADLPEDSDIYVNIIPYNLEGEATGCSEESFVTELIPVPPVCTNLNTPLANATDVPIDTSLSWDTVPNATGYLVIIGTTSGGIEVANNVDVGNQTTYDIPVDLQEDRLHYVTIIPYNDEGDAAGCMEETFTTGNSTSPPSCTRLSAPLDNATSVSPATNLTWNTLTSATGYKLSIGTTTGGSDIYTGDLGDINTFDPAADLPESTTVYVTVTPYNDNGDAIGCIEESFTTDGPPLCTTLNSPSNNATNVAFDLSSISWNASINADGYRVTVMASNSTDNNVNDFDVTSGTTYNFSNDFEQGETVTVTIVPYNNIGDATGPCTSENFTIIPPPVPACTTLSSATSDVALRPTIEWNSSTGADGYKLTVLASSSTANNVTELDIPSGTTYSFTNDFEQGEIVDITIIPYNDQGDAVGCMAETISVRPVPGCNSLIVPGDLAVDVAVDTDISWTTVSDATGYKLTVTAGSSTDNNITDELITSGNSYDFPFNFEPGETVTVTIVPYNESGDALNCAPESFTIKPVPGCTNLDTPTDNSVDVALDTDLSWNAVSDANGYRVTVNASNSIANNQTYDVTGTTIDLTNDFEQGETVEVTITPYNEVGDAINCTTESFTIKPIPSCTNLTSPENNAIDIPVATDITWNPVDKANGYRVTVNASVSNVNNQTYDVSANTLDLPGNFEQGETVTVTITPYNEVGDAIGCNTESFTIKSVPLCTNLIAPQDEQIVAQARDISWNPIADADGYKLTISGSSTTINDITDFEFSGTTYVFPNEFTQGETVTVIITPFNELGDAIGCTSESFTIRPIPTCTNLVSPFNNAGQVSVMTDISWNPSFDADGYRVSVGTTPNGTDIVNDEDVASLTSYTFGQDLPSETLIYVTITPYNTSGSAVGCTSDSFTTEVIIPECAELSSPSNGEEDIPLESTISWNEVEKTDGYRISIGTTPGGNDIVDNQDMGAETSYSHSEEFPFDTEIFVTIIPYNSAGEATQCEEQSFTTEIPEDNTKYGFSPDGDGINEYWHIENIEYYPENMVTIYNRWGDAVFQIENYDNGSEVFRGDANLKTKMGAGRLPSGTYFFHIQIEGETILKKTKGYVVIKR